MISGDGNAIRRRSKAITYWSCRSNPYTDILGFALGSTVPGPFCPGRAKVVLNVDFPDCWDGANLKSADHTSHLAYAARPSLWQWRVCPASHPVPIPALNLKIVYPTSGARFGAKLSSGGTCSAHMDFMDGWGRSKLTALVQNCINRAISCKAP